MAVDAGAGPAPRDEATVDLSCPEGCFDLEIRGHHDLLDAADYLMELAVQKDPGPCPHCGAEIDPEVDG